MWNLDSGEERSSFTCEGIRLAFSPDSRRVAVAKLDGTVTIRDVDDAREVLALVGHSDAVSCLAFSPDGRRLLTGSQDQSIRLWDLTSGLETFSLRGHTSGLSDVRFGRDGEVIVAASKDGTIRVWDAPRVATTGR